MNRKKIFSWLLTLAIILGMMPSAVSAQDFFIEPAFSQDEENDETGSGDLTEPEDISLEGEGTQETPFILSDYEDLCMLRDLVNSGTSFSGLFLAITEDIETEEDWSPIGVTIDGTDNIGGGDNLYAFCGTLDGQGHTVAMAQGSRPLFGYVRDASILNLKIYGEQIDGYGLINNLEGVGLSGNAVILDNITLLGGSSTLKSGLLGANITTNQYAGTSAPYLTTIRNCTVEEGVVIGYLGDQSHIGSFAGRLNGTIENCVSYAQVYGMDYVGGIIGSRDNSMGTCIAENCQFYGTVTAAGDHAGGIAGGGYSNSSAPNAFRITVKNCTVEADIAGRDKVGGILGGDSFVAQVWDSYEFKNNSFTGNVSASDGSYAGGIIGYYRSLNRYDDIAGNTYTCNLVNAFGGVKFVDTRCEDHETRYGEIYFNTSGDKETWPAVDGCAWKKRHNRIDDPLGADRKNLCSTDEDPFEIEEIRNETAQVFADLYARIEPDQQQYTVSTFTELKNAYEAFAVVVADENAGISELRAARDAVQTAYDSLAEKGQQTLTVTAEKGSKGYAALKKAACTFKLITVSKHKGSLTYTKASGSSKYATVNKSTGKITLAKKTPAGTYTVKVTVKAAETEDYFAASKTVTVKITVTKAAQPMTVKTAAKNAAYTKLARGNVVIAGAVSVSGAQGKVTYAKTGGNAKITVNKSTGRITLKKGLKKGTYKVKIKVTAAGNANYKAGSKTVTVTIKVK